MFKRVPRVKTGTLFSVCNSEGIYFKFQEDLDDPYMYYMELSKKWKKSSEIVINLRNEDEIKELENLLDWLKSDKDVFCLHCDCKMHILEFWRFDDFISIAYFCNGSISKRQAVNFDTLFKEIKGLSDEIEKILTKRSK